MHFECRTGGFPDSWHTHCMLTCKQIAILKTSSMKKRLQPLILIVVVLAIAITARAFGLDRKLGGLRDWIAAQGVWGPFLFAALYSLAAVAAIPGAPLTMAAGALFGSVVGVISVIFGATLGASFCFLISRYFAREAVAESLRQNERFRKLDDMTRRHGDIIVAITRLVPLFPYNLLNYGFGLTGVRFRSYVAWTFVCMLPGTILYVVGADAVTTAIEEGRVPWVLVLIVLLIMAVLYILVQKARARLKENENDDSAGNLWCGGFVKGGRNLPEKALHALARTKKRRISKG